MADAVPSASSSSPSSSPQQALPFPFSFGNPFSSLTSALFSNLPFHPKLTASSSPSSPPIVSTSSGDARGAPDRPTAHNSSQSPPPPARKAVAVPATGLDGLKFIPDGFNHPAFVGQVFTMLDPSGNGLMAVTTKFELPFLSERAPEWFKRMLAKLAKSDSDPVFRFFLDLNDAVSYVKHLNIPSAVVGSCRLDLAYEHFKEKPNMFQFVANKKQIQAANKLLKELPCKGRRRRLDGVPVFSASNINIAIATDGGIRWYRPYFFDKAYLDDILESTMDQHYGNMIQNRYVQRRKDVIDDSFSSDMIENGDNLLEPPEVRELMNEIGHFGVPVNAVSKVAEIQFLDVVDKVLLGNKWLRKAVGIQPKFPYVVDSFEERCAASFCHGTAPTSSVASSSKHCSSNELGKSNHELCTNEHKSGGAVQTGHGEHANSPNQKLPFSEWLSTFWPKDPEKYDEFEHSSNARSTDSVKNSPLSSPVVPEIMMLGISTSEYAQMSKGALKKMMDDMTKELEQVTEQTTMGSRNKAPIFFANVREYSKLTRVNT